MKFRFKKLESHHKLFEFSKSPCSSNFFSMQKQNYEEDFDFGTLPISTSAEHQVKQKVCIMGIRILIIKTNQPCIDFNKRYVHMSGKKLMKSVFILRSKILTCGLIAAR